MTSQFVAVGLYCAHCIKLKLIFSIMTAEFFLLWNDLWINCCSYLSSTWVLSIQFQHSYMCWKELPKLWNANAYLGYFADPYTCRCRRGRGLWAGGNFFDGSHIWVKCKYTFQVNLCRETYGRENMNVNKSHQSIFLWCCPVLCLTHTTTNGCSISASQTPK